MKNYENFGQFGNQFAKGNGLFNNQIENNWLKSGIIGNFVIRY